MIIEVGIGSSETQIISSLREANVVRFVTQFPEIANVGRLCSEFSGFERVLTSGIPCIPGYVFLSGDTGTPAGVIGIVVVVFTGRRGSISLRLTRFPRILVEIAGCTTSI